MRFDELNVLKLNGVAQLILVKSLNQTFLSFKKNHNFFFRVEIFALTRLKRIKKLFKMYVLKKKD